MSGWVSLVPLGSSFFVREHHSAIRGVQRTCLLRQGTGHSGIHYGLHLLLHPVRILVRPVRVQICRHHSGWEAYCFFREQRYQGSDPLYICWFIFHWKTHKILRNIITQKKEETKEKMYKVSLSVLGDWFWSKKILKHFTQGILKFFD